MSEIFVQVLLPLALNEAFTYSSDELVEIGAIVEVEFGKKKIWGVVVALLDQPPTELAAKIKKVIRQNNRIKLSQNLLKFIEIIAGYNLGTRGLVLRAFIGILNSDKTKKDSKSFVQEVEPKNFSLKKLLPRQQEIFDQLSNFEDGVSLVDGVTGSGKTEIYFALVAKILRENPHSQILLMLPEIALTSQLLLRFEGQFGFKAALWHSKISKKERREIFYGIADGSVRVLIGARSSLLLPFKNLQLLVIDEEHDSSFKQEDVFNFNARDMGIVRANIEDFPVILSSATPAVETFINATSGKYRHFVLEQKFGAKNEIELIDLRREKMQKNQFISQQLREEMVQNLALSRQTLLFLNRRGYAPVTICRSCGEKYDCPNCDFHLVMHKSKNQLVCHHCGHFESIVKNCKFCGEQHSLIPLGAGVEKLAEEVAEFLPSARIALVTSDNVSNFHEVDELVEKILRNEIDVIIGTQMITKGHDFPALTLVGIVDADGLLYSSELRSLEKAYQIMTQVIGRAGRRSEQGRVIIQTYNPENLLLKQLIADDKKSFYDFEVRNRQSLDLPPFSRMVKIEVSAFSESEAKSFAKKLIQFFPVSDKVEIFGPAPAAVQRLKNRHHFLLNIKAQRRINLQKLITDVIKNINPPTSIRIRTDIDPI